MTAPRALAGLALTLLLPALLVAQDKPTPQSLKDISGTWRLDESHSPPMPGAAAVTPPRQVAETTTVSGFVTVRGGAGGAGEAAAEAARVIARDIARDAGNAAAAGGPPPGRAGGRPAGVGGQSPYMRQLIAQMQPPPTLIIRAAESTIALSVPEGEPTEWPTTGKKRQKAQLDGTLLEFNGRWERDKLTLIDVVSGTAELKREFHVVKKGQVLQVKLSVSGPAMPRRMERKVVYTRVE